MTNEPLTAEERLYLIGNGVYLPPVEAMDAWMEDNKPILDLVDMRVAKATAGLQAENEQLKKQLEELEADYREMSYHASLAS